MYSAYFRVDFNLFFEINDECVKDAGFFWLALTIPESSLGYIHIFIYICVYIYIYLCVSVYVCIQICVYVCVYIYMCIFKLLLHTHTH